MDVKVSLPLILNLSKEYYSSELDKNVLLMIISRKYKLSINYIQDKQKPKHTVFLVIGEYILVAYSLITCINYVYILYDRAHKNFVFGANKNVSGKF